MVGFSALRSLVRHARLVLPVLLLVLPLSAPLAATQAHAATVATTGDPFYVPPDPLPPGSPGDVIRWRASAAPLVAARAWQVLYRSTTALGGPTAVSGTVLVPLAPFAGARPVVAYAAGTQGWGDQCAPSKSIAAGVFDEQFAVNNLLGQGWAVVVTDYPGLGTPGDETYNVGIPEGYAVLDALRAATRLPETGLQPSAAMAIEGYSQGGGAADWAAQLQPTYAPELRLAGVAGGGTPANLQAVARNINGTAWFAFLAGTAIGFNAAYPAIDFRQYLTAEGQAAMDQLSMQCQATALLQFAGKRIEDYTIGGINPIGEPPVKAVLDLNNLGAIGPAVPVLQYHGLVDEIIPWRVETDLHDRWCAAGVRTLLKGYLSGHVLTHVVAQGDVVSWLRGRLAGSPAPRNC
jgi:Secretory lipase